MSKVYPRFTGWVGYGQGAELFVREDMPLDADHALVVERPELFADHPAAAEATAESASAVEALLKRVQELEERLAAAEAKPARASRAKAAVEQATPEGGGGDAG